MQAASWELGAGDERTWSEEICDRLLGADAPQAAPGAGARVELRPRDPVIALDLHVRHGALAIGRGARRIAEEARPPAFGVTLVTGGAARLSMASGERDLVAGDLCVLHSGEPFVKRMGPGYGEAFLYLPRPAVEEAVGARVGDLVPGVKETRGLAGLFADGMAALHRRRAELAPAEWKPLVLALMQLMAAAFLGGAAESARPPARTLQRQRALRHLERHLADPALNPRAVAAALGMSVRYLHLLFEEGGASVGATILALRLDRCREALATRDGRSICEVAFSWGFSDAGHFSRAFKARFGISPRDARARPAS
jgi:AraC-like DNA-binding protein